MASFDRREFLSALGAWGLAASAPHALAQAAAPRFSAYPFTLGVASGYPRPDGVTLWTRLAPAPDAADGGMAPANVPVRWEVATDEAFRTIVAAGNEAATSEWAHSIHVD